ncbi:hypothetical protein NUW58_g3257 [Xylaria curta]|uniref:Uncharacterized protein n=1 Tax=Xylaria curta TaxID=42375 RepID=A0ACC1PD11_9PEZI|nr:hypothetical protein NUW58_g3257 [Xylaria curta]
MSTRSPVHPQNWLGLIKAFCEALIALIVPVLSMPFLRPIDHKVVHVIQHTTSQASMSVNTDAMATEWSQRNDNHKEEVHLHNMTMGKPDTRFNAEHQQPGMAMNNENQPEKQKKEQMRENTNTAGHINITLTGCSNFPITQLCLVNNNAPSTSTIAPVSSNSTTTVVILIVKRMGHASYATALACMLLLTFIFWFLKPEIHIK